MMKKERTTQPERKGRLGRPRVPSRNARPNRLVTFVTDQELRYLTQVTVDEERSMASVIHRIIAAHIGVK